MPSTAIATKLKGCNSLFQNIAKSRYARWLLVRGSICAFLAFPQAFAANDTDIEEGAIVATRLSTTPSPGAELFDISMPGERFQPLTGSIGHVASDLSLVGDGLLSFELTRRYEPVPAAYPYAFGTMSLDVPTLRFRTQHSAGRPRDPLDNTCSNLTGSDPKWSKATNELFDDLRFTYGDTTTSLLPKGLIQEAVWSNYPSDAIAASKENFYLSCDGDTFVVRDPNGIEYRFDGRLNSEMTITTEVYRAKEGNEMFWFNLYTVKASSIQRMNAAVHLEYETVPNVTVNGSMRDTRARFPYHTSGANGLTTVDHILRNPRRLVRVKLAVAPDTGSAAWTTQQLDIAYRTATGACPGLVETAVVRADNKSSEPDRVLRTIRYAYTPIAALYDFVTPEHMGSPRSGCVLTTVSRHREDAQGGVAIPQWSFEYGVKGGDITSGGHGYAPFVLTSGGKLNSKDLAQAWAVRHRRTFVLPLRKVVVPTGASVEYEYEKLKRCWYQVDTSNSPTANSARACREASTPPITAAIEKRKVVISEAPEQITQFTRARASQLLFTTTIASETRHQMLQFGRVFPHLWPSAVALSPSDATDRKLRDGGRLLVHQIAEPSGKIAATTTFNYAEGELFIKRSSFRLWTSPSSSQQGDLGTFALEGWQWRNARADYRARERRINLASVRVDMDGHQFTTRLSSFDSYNNPTMRCESMKRSDGANRTERCSVLAWDNAHAAKAVYAVGLPASVQTSMTGDSSSGSSTLWNAHALRQETVIDGLRTTFTYWNNGNLKTRQAGADGTTAFRGYRLGHPTRIESAANGLQTFDIDDRGSVTSTRTKLDGARQIRIDQVYGGAFSERIATRRTGASDVTVEHPTWRDPNDGSFRTQIADRVERQAGSYTAYDSHDSFGRLIKSWNNGAGESERRVVKQRYDAAGRLKYRADPTGTGTSDHRTAYRYDALDRLVSVQHIRNDKTTGKVTYCYGPSCDSDPNYNSVGSVGFGVARRDELGKVTVRKYRAFGHPSNAELVEIREAIEPPSFYTDRSPRRVTWIRRNHAGFVTSIRQGGDESGNAQLTRTFVPREVGGLVTSEAARENHPEFGTRKVTRFDASGRPIEVANFDGSVLSYAYDGAGRPISISTPSTRGVIETAGRITRTYFDNGALKTLADAGTSWSFDYTARGELAEETLTVDGQSFPLRYRYDNRTHLVSITYPSGRVVEHETNGFGEVKALFGLGNSEYASGVLRNTRGALTFARLGSGAEIVRNYDERWRPSEIRVTVPNAERGTSARVFDLGYEYTARDNVSRVTGYFREADGTTSDLTNLQYDALGRLRRADGTWGIAQYAYDVFGNLQRRYVGGKNFDLGYHASKNLLSSIKKVGGIGGSHTRAVSHDANGNLTGDGNRTFRFDHLNRLRSATDIDGETQLSRYDGRNHRVSIQVQTPQRLERTWFVYGSNGLLLHERDEWSGETRDHIYLDGQSIATHVDHDEHDTDGDGLPDFFERQFGLNAFAAGDDAADADGDGLTNLEEYLGGLVPTSIDSDGDGIDDFGPEPEPEPEPEPVDDRPALPASGDAHGEAAWIASVVRLMLF